MRDSSRSSGSSHQQPRPSSASKRKRTTPQQTPENPTPSKRRSTIRYIDQDESPSRLKHEKTSHRNGIESSSRSQKASSAMYAFGKPGGDHVIDLTASPNLLASRAKGTVNKSAPRKLVVKNLRAETAWDVDQYLDQTWRLLDDTITSVFANKFDTYSIDRMYGGVENLCKQAKGAVLYTRLRDRTKKRAKQMLQECLQFSDQTLTASVLDSVISAWTQWQTQMREIRRIFYYLDRSYILQNAKPSINDVGVTAFHDQVFEASKVRQHVIDGACELIEKFRTDQTENIDRDRLRVAVCMFHELSVYTQAFEPIFLARSQVYIIDWVREATANNEIDGYVNKVNMFISTETETCESLGLDSSTRRSLLLLLEEAAIRQQVKYLTSRPAISKLLQDNAVERLSELYDLLKRIRQASTLRVPFAAWTEQVGTEICFDDSSSDDMIVRLLSLKRRLDNVWHVSFKRDDEISRGLRDAFGKFINKTKKTSSTWNTDNSKTGEMMAKYVDLLLKGGSKVIPTELTGSKAGMEGDEEDGNVDEDQAVNEQMDQVLDLFRFLQGKAVFEAFYKRDLAKRLLLGRSASADAEQNMLGRLKTECGASFTQNLEQMFKDVELSREELAGYKERLEHLHSRPGDLDLDVNILSAAAWPTYPDVTVRIPPNVAKAIEDFERYYQSKHSGRKLAWKHALANCQVKASFPKGNKQIVVSSFQAIVLLLFNRVKHDEHLTYEHIKTETNLPEAEVKRTLQSLACTKLRPLIKHPQGKDINESDTFSVNTSFSHPKYRVRINQIQLKETKEENKQTHERVAEDRNFECQAAIVRIMKSRKQVSHSELIAEVINATRSRGVLAVPDIKKNIDRLIEKDYIEREDGNMYAYLA